MHICIPIKEKNTVTLVSALKKANKLANIIEIWFDELKDLDTKNLQKILKIAKKPILYKVSKFTRKNIDLVLSSGQITYLDIDLALEQTIIKKIKKENPKLKLIISYHNLKKTPSFKELHKLAHKISEKGANIVKIATRANSLEDSLNMLSFLSQLSTTKPAICLCMGMHGQLTRATGHLFGNYLMYAPMNAAQKTAPGQIPAHELKKILKSNN